MAAFGEAGHDLSSNDGTSDLALLNLAIHTDTDMKTGEVQDPGDGTGPYLDTDSWSPWQYHMHEDEFRDYWTAANALMMRLERMPPAVRNRLKRIDIRCPAKGCKLATIYWIPRRPTPEDIEHYRKHGLRNKDGRHTYPLERGDYFYVGRTAGGTEVYDILNYPASRTWKDEVRGCSCCRILYWRSGCRHGTASIDREPIYSMFSLADRRYSPRRSEEETIKSLPAHLRPFWGKRVFHPDPAAWHPKKRSPRPGIINPANSTKHARAANGV